MSIEVQEHGTGCDQAGNFGFGVSVKPWISGRRELAIANRHAHNPQTPAVHHASYFYSACKRVAVARPHQRTPNSPPVVSPCPTGAAQLINARNTSLDHAMHSTLDVPVSECLLLGRTPTSPPTVPPAPPTDGSPFMLTLRVAPALSVAPTVDGMDTVTPAALVSRAMRALEEREGRSEPTPS